MIKAIVFDLDDTLYRQEVPFVAAIKLVFPQLIEEELSSFLGCFEQLVINFMSNQDKKMDHRCWR